MPTCRKCNHKWTWLETIKRTFKKKKKCPYCGGIQFISFKSSQRIAWYGLMIPFVLIIAYLLSMPRMVAMIVSGLIIVIGFLTQPFLTTLSNEEEFPE